MADTSAASGEDVGDSGGLSYVKLSLNKREHKMRIMAPMLIRWAGLAAIVGGIIFAGIQPIHPPDVLESVTTTFWAVIISMKFAMCFLFLPAP